MNNRLVAEPPVSLNETIWKLEPTLLPDSAVLSARTDQRLSVPSGVRLLDNVLANRSSRLLLADPLTRRIPPLTLTFEPKNPISVVSKSYGILNRDDFVWPSLPVTSIEK